MGEVVWTASGLPKPEDDGPARVLHCTRAVSAAQLAAIAHLLRECDLSWRDLLCGSWAVLHARMSREQRVTFAWAEGARAEAVSLTVPPDARPTEWLRQASTATDVVPLAAGAPRPELALVLADSHGSDLAADARLVLGFRVGRELILSARYESNAFATPAVERLLGHLETLLAAIARGDTDRVADLPLLTEPERARIAAWNDTATPRGDLCLHTLVEEQVDRTPDAVAVVCGNAQLSYRELDRRANQLAQHLGRLGVGAETRVGILGERSVEIAVAFLAVLKAGGAYVPLDPDDPPSRLAFQLENAAIEVVLTMARFAPRLGETRAAVVCLDRDASALAREREARPSVAVSPRNLAYVLYTSGSTGRPKGAMNEHRGICNRLLWMQQTYRAGASDRVLQKTPFGFDVSGWEIFWPWISGARLVFAAPGGHRDSAYLAQLIREQGITIVHFVPSMLRVFLEDPSAGRCRSLRQVIASGEELTSELAQRFHALLPAELDNLYGPTEAAIDVSRWRCGRDGATRAVPIGRPVANTRLHILDTALRPLPVGVAGELCIGGVQVGRGYCASPELTEAAFVADPYGTEPGARLYRTGDLARYREDGNIEFLGRIDHQVKIRGARIELGEIEATLGRVSGVRACVALAREYAAGDRRLVAYLVAQAGADAEALTRLARREVAAELPASMHPAAYVVLDELPLGSNGKVDRKALPAPPARRSVRSAGARADALAQFLHELWCEVLELESVGPDEAFFELGGSSLLAARVVNRVQEKLGEQIFVVALFEAPTLASFGAYLAGEYPRAVRAVFGAAALPPDGTGARASRAAASRAALTREDLERVRALSRGDRAAAPEIRRGAGNPRALFLLSTHRSGTTLLRAMLAGHPGLFAASELQLLGFSTLEERRAAFTGSSALWLEGTQRAVMEIHGCDAEAAGRTLAECEAKGLTTQQLYRVLQDWVEPRMLLDKTPGYALDRDTLQRAECWFEDARYIHLVRHPLAMVRSARDFHMDQIWQLRDPDYTSRDLAELIWTLSHENVLEFLSDVPEERWCRIHFEDLVQRPRPALEQICRAANLPFHPDLLDPYKDQEHKMLDGIHPESMPMGDTRFHGYSGIEPEVAEKWQQGAQRTDLCEMTWQLAERLGYETPEPETARAPGSGLARQRALRRRHRSG